MAETRQMFELEDLKSIRVGCSKPDCDGGFILPPGSSPGRRTNCPACGTSLELAHPNEVTRALFSRNCFDAMQWSTLELLVAALLCLLRKLSEGESPAAPNRISVQLEFQKP